MLLPTRFASIALSMGFERRSSSFLSLAGIALTSGCVGRFPKTGEGGLLTPKYLYSFGITASSAMVFVKEKYWMCVC